MGYAVGSLWALALSVTLPMNRADATITGTLIAFVICAVAAMWAYAAASGWRAIWTLSLIGALGWLLLKVAGA